MDKDFSEKLAAGIMNGFSLAFSLAILILILMTYIGAGHGL